MKKEAIQLASSVIFTMMSVIIIILAMILSIWYQPLKINQAQLWTLSSHTNLRQEIITMHQQKLIAYPWVLRLIAHWDQHPIQAGTYRLYPTMRWIDLVHGWQHGRVAVFYFHIPEGFSWMQLSRIAALQGLPFYRDIPVSTDCQIWQQWEGNLYPGNYQYHAGDKLSAILTKSRDQMIFNLNDAWQNRDLTIPLNHAKQALVLASLLQKEADTQEDMMIIAGILYHRMQLKMRLQLDSTVNYSNQMKAWLPECDRSLIKDYNTYLHLGLPPTPISTISRSSLYAALHPKNSSYLYFFADSHGNITYSKTYQQHKQAFLLAS